MPACPPNIELRLHEEALLDLVRTARAFAHAIARAAETGAALPDEAVSELAARVIDDCRAALLPALASAPGMLQLFTIPGIPT
jgi:hypothetical protein